MTITDALSRTTLFQRDAAARPVSATAPDGANLALAFDAHDNVASVTPPGKSAHAFSYTPDDLEASYAPPTSGPTKTTFDADRRPLVTTRPDGSTWTRTYDTAGRPASFGYAGGLTIATSYDDKGRVSALAGPGAESVAVSYDGPLVTSLAFTGAATGTLGWTYDTRFRVSREEINGGFGVDVAYDHDGLLTSVGDLTLDRETTTGRIASLAVGSVKTTATYSPYGEVATLGSSDGGSTMLDLAFTYDVLGRITTKTDTGVAWSYAYDLAGRLANVKKDGVAVATYTYDANGNRLNDGATYDEEDRQLTGNGATFTYTPNGERKTRVDGTGTTTYGYDGRGHLTRVALPNGKQLAYGVDARGRRISRSENGVVTHRWLFRDQLQPVAEVDESGAVTTRYVYATRVNVPDYFVRGDKTYAVLTDQLGSVRKVVDAATGEVVQELAYDAWGVVTLDTNPGFQPFGFAGGVWDGASGLTHFGAREYEAGTGRWTRKDPIGFGGGLNGFAYANEDAVNQSDPDGHKPGDAFSSAFAAAFDASRFRDRSDGHDREWGGFVYKKDGSFYATEGEGDSSTGLVKLVLADIPRGGVPVGDWHTHGSKCAQASERFSDGDISGIIGTAQKVYSLWTNSKRGMPYVGYLATPRGDFYTYEVAGGIETRYPRVMPACPCP